MFAGDIGCEKTYFQEGQMNLFLLGYLFTISSSTRLFLSRYFLWPAYFCPYLDLIFFSADTSTGKKLWFFPSGERKKQYFFPHCSISWECKWDLNRDKNKQDRSFYDTFEPLTHWNSTVDCCKPTECLPESNCSGILPESGLPWQPGSFLQHLYSQDVMAVEFHQKSCHGKEKASAWWRK